MKRNLAIAVLLCACCATSFAYLASILLPAPQDDTTVRRALRDNLELKPLADERHAIIETRLSRLKLDQVAKIFGQRLGPAANSWTDGYPSGLALPSFSPVEVGVYRRTPGDPAQDKSHTDLHAVGDIGYIEFYYRPNGESIETAAIYFRVDDKFVPLKSTNDLPARLEWDKAKFEAFKKWLDEHLPGK